MSPEQLALACVIAPLVGFFIALVGFRRKHGPATAIVLVSGAVSLVCSALLLLQGAPEDPALTARWFVIGNVSIDFGLLLDGRNLIMGAVVGLITFCIQVYSISYMSADPGRARFFAMLAFFEWSMLNFVYSASLLQSFIFWELVGLASFFLIGFWYHKPSAVAAAKKAFLMTRIGDVGLFIGLILLFRATGTLDVLGINGMFEGEGLPAGMDPVRIEWIAGLLFLGVIGKSAQFPLHTWLPDAMEGPTPVSALLHSATMVAAGVFLVARFHGLFLDAPTTMQIMLAVAAFTALLSSTMAMVAKDMKRVLAFSSISQLGFMLMGLAAGSLFAGYFHLTTHAFFKALLFLCAGSFIHHYGTNDMIAMGRAGARSMRVTTLGLVVGGAALAGIPPLAGFFSKEQIIGSLHGPGAVVFQIAAYAAAFLTAYYTFRMIFLVLRPNADSEAEEDEAAYAQFAADGAHDTDGAHAADGAHTADGAHAADAAHSTDGAHGHAHGSHGSSEPFVVVAPILLLTALAAAAGFLGDRIGHILHIDHIHHPSIQEMAPAVAIALAGVLLAWLDFGRKGARQVGIVAMFPSLRTLFEKRWYIDEIYNAVFVRGAVAIAKMCYGTETKGFDQGMDMLGEGTVKGGGAVARSHTGRLQLYIGAAAVVVALLALYLGMQ